MPHLVCSGLPRAETCRVKVVLLEFPDLGIVAEVHVVHLDEERPVALPAGGHYEPSVGFLDEFTDLGFRESPHDHVDALEGLLQLFDVARTERRGNLDAVLLGHVVDDFLRRLEGIELRIELEL